MLYSLRHISCLWGCHMKQSPLVSESTSTPFLSNNGDAKRYIFKTQSAMFEYQTPQRHGLHNFQPSPWACCSRRRGALRWRRAGSGGEGCAGPVFGCLWLLAEFPCPLLPRYGVEASRWQQACRCPVPCAACRSGAVPLAVPIPASPRPGHLPAGVLQPSFFFLLLGALTLEGRVRVPSPPHSIIKIKHWSPSCTGSWEQGT